MTSKWFWTTIFSTTCFRVRTCG